MKMDEISSGYDCSIKWQWTELEIGRLGDLEIKRLEIGRFRDLEIKFLEISQFSPRTCASFLYDVKS